MPGKFLIFILGRGLISVNLLRYRPHNQKTSKGGGGRGGAKPHDETPHRRNGFRPPSPRYGLPPPPFSISLSKSRRNSQNCPQPTSSETAFGGSRKMVSDGPSSRGFAFGTFCRPLPLALPSTIKGARKLGTPRPPSK